MVNGQERAVGNLGTCVIDDGRMANVDAIVNKPVRVTYFSDY